MDRGTDASTSTADQDDDVSAIIASFAGELQDVTKPLAILVQFHVRDGTQELVEAAFAEAGIWTAAEPGAIAYELHRERQAPTRFVVYERWRSLADLDAHLRMPYIHAVRRVIADAMVGAPAFRVLIPAGVPVRSAEAGGATTQNLTP